MKRLLAATSAFALVLGGTAFAQSNSGGMNSNPNIGMMGGQHGTMENSQRGMTGGQSQEQQGQPGTMGTQGQNAMPSHRPPMRSGAAQYVSQQEIKQAQTELKQQGLYNGAIDGIVGPQTKSAISQFQKREGLPQTASLDQQTLSHLMSSGNSGSSGSSGSTNEQNEEGGANSSGAGGQTQGH
jgi:hypothetical protein